MQATALPFPEAAGPSSEEVDDRQSQTEQQREGHDHGECRRDCIGLGEQGHNPATTKPKREQSAGEQGDAY